MSTAPLRKAGGSVTVTIPPAYLRDAGLGAGSVVCLEIVGDKLTISPAQRRVSLQDIVASAPQDAKSLRSPGWDVMKPVGNET